MLPLGLGWGMMDSNGQVRGITSISCTTSILTATMGGQELDWTGCLVLMLDARRMWQKCGLENLLEKKIMTQKCTLPARQLERWNEMLLSCVQMKKKKLPGLHLCKVDFL